MKPRYKRNSPKYIRLQAYEMYKDGLSFYDIAAKLHISHQQAEHEVLAYVRTHDIDTGKLEADRHTILSLRNSLNKANHAHIEPGYGFKDMSHIVKRYSNENLETRLPEPHLSWFDKIKLAIYHLFFFWK